MNIQIQINPQQIKINDNKSIGAAIYFIKIK